MVELRMSRRYRLQAEAFFFWERPDGLLQEGKGAIRDISDRGVFVTGEVVPPPGVHLEVDVLLPSLEASSGAAKLHGEGTVIRIERDGESIKGFAADVTFQTEAASGPNIADPNKRN